MLIRKQAEVPANPVTLPGAEKLTMRLMVGREHGAPTFAMRIFDVAPGGHTPHHAHNYEHQVMILEGTGHAVGGPDGATQHPVQAGDVLFIPANETHQFRNTSSTPMRFMCLVPTQFDCGQGQCAPTPGS